MGKSKKQTKLNIKIVIGVILAVVAIGTVGRWDAEYEARPSVCREYQGSTVCYQP